MANHSFSRFARPLIAIAAIAGFLALGVASSASATSPDDHLVTPAELGSAYAAPGETTWLSDLSGGGTNTMTTDSFDGRSSLKMSVPGANGQVNAFKTFGSGVRPTDIPALLAGSSFSYAGNTVNFQIAMFYTPVDIAHYGPQGSTIACTPAVDGGVT
ncbi:MAG: hypothetical protein JWO10_1965, partial [Microbacteriaceae bacterium]|nr:hypothetical protein [Microbacteriaceae bacterium]